MNFSTLYVSILVNSWQYFDLTRAVSVVAFAGLHELLLHFPLIAAFLYILFAIARKAALETGQGC